MRKQTSTEAILRSHGANRGRSSSLVRISLNREAPFTVSLVVRSFVIRKLQAPRHFRGGKIDRRADLEAVQWTKQVTCFAIKPTVTGKNHYIVFVTLLDLCTDYYRLYFCIMFHVWSHQKGSLFRYSFLLEKMRSSRSRQVVARNYVGEGEGGVFDSARSRHGRARVYARIDAYDVFVAGPVVGQEEAYAAEHQGQVDAIVVVDGRREVLEALGEVEVVDASGLAQLDVAPAQVLVHVAGREWNWRGDGSRRSTMIGARRMGLPTSP